jgi:hypothetical protein
MEDIISYIIVFGLIITFTWIYFSKKEKGKRFSLTKKEYSFGSIEVWVEKKGSDIVSLAVEIVSGKDDYQPDSLFVDLMDKNRNIEALPIPSEIVIAERKDNFVIDYSGFSKLIKENQNSFETFRFTAGLPDSRKLKTGWMVFNKRWSLYVPDTGKYN